MSAAARRRGTAGDGRGAGSVIVTHPGPDQGREEILAALTSEAAAHPTVTIVPSLGVLYPAFVAACDLVAGNSSSGIIEAAAFEVPAVDIGTRQRGRLRGRNVLHADEGFPAVSDAVSRAVDPAFRATLRGMSQPLRRRLGRRADRGGGGVVGGHAVPASGSRTAARRGGGRSSMPLKDSADFLLDEAATLRDVMTALDRHGHKAVVLVSADRMLSGLLTDGDVRRACWRAPRSTTPPSPTPRRTPTVVRHGAHRGHVLDLMRALHIEPIPSVDDRGRRGRPAHPVRTSSGSQPCCPTPP